MPVAIVGAAMSRFDPRPELPPADVVYPVVKAALADAGVAMAEIHSVITCSQDIYDGRTISSMGVNEVVGGYLRSESKIAGEGLLALLYGAARILSGEYELTLVVAHCLESMGDAQVVENAAFDPYVQRPLGPDRTIAAALQAGAFYATSGLGPSDSAEVAARASEKAARNPRACRKQPFSAAEVAASATICGPLRELEGSPVADGACALVLASSARAGTGAVWLRGLATQAATFWTDRELTDVGTLRAATARAAAQAGLETGDCEVVETAARWAHEQLMHLPALGVGAGADVNPSGGQLGGCPYYVAGLARAAEAVLAIRSGAEHALVHAPSGIANQQHTVGFLSRREGGFDA